MLRSANLFLVVDSENQLKTPHHVYPSHVHVKIIIKGFSSPSSSSNYAVSWDPGRHFSRSSTRHKSGRPCHFRKKKKHFHDARTMANDQWPSAHLPLPNCSCGCYGYCSCPCGPFGCCNGVQAPPTRRSRFDEFCTQAPPPPMTTLFRAQSCRRLGEEGENNLPEMLCCREQRLSPPAATTAACLCDAPPQMFLTPPIVLKVGLAREMSIFS